MAFPTTYRPKTLEDKVRRGHIRQVQTQVDSLPVKADLHANKQQEARSKEEKEAQEKQLADDLEKQQAEDQAKQAEEKDNATEEVCVLSATINASLVYLDDTYMNSLFARIGLLDSPRNWLMESWRQKW